MPQSATLSAQEHAAKFSKKRRTIALIIVSIAFIMDLLDSTIVNIAIPSIRLNLHATYSDIQWIIAGYSLAFAVLLVTGGRMGDVFGYKKLFMIGVSGFTIASLLSGLSPNPQVLIFARIFQGSMAALMVPQVMSLMQVMYKPEERGPINGLFGGFAGVAATLGPIIGGILIQANIANLNWRPIFLINVPVGIFGLIAAIKYLPNGKSPHPLKLDIFGTLLVIIGLLLLIFPLIEGRELDWPKWIFLMMLCSIPFFIVFSWWQKVKMKKDGSPLIIPSLIKDLGFKLGLSVNLLFEMALVGFFLTFGLFLQIGALYTPLHAAVTGVPLAIGISLTMGILGEKISKIGKKALLIGTVIMAVGIISISYLFYHYTINIHSWQLIPGLIVTGIGMGFVFGSLFGIVLNGVDPTNAGSASGTLNAVQQLGGAIGIALVGVVFFGQLSHASSSSFDKVKPQISASLSTLNIPNDQQSNIIEGSKKCFVDRSKEKDSSVVPASCKAIAGSNSPLNKQVGQIISEKALKANANNFASAYRWSTIYSLVLLIVTFMLTLFLPSRKFGGKNIESVHN